MNSTPRCASETAPGRAMPLPPPTSAAIELEWWGATNGGTVLSAPPAGSRPATDRMAASASASAGASRGSSPTNRWASIVLPVPGGPTSRTWWPPAAAISSACRASSCPTTSARSGGSGPGSSTGGSGRRSCRSPWRNASVSERLAAPWTSMPSTSAASRQHGGRDDGPAHPGRPCGEQARQHPAHRAQPPVEGQLAQQDRAVQCLLPDHPARAEDGAGQRQVEAAARLAQGGRRQRQHDPLVGPLLLGVDHRRAHPVLGLVQRRVGQPDQVEAGQPAPDVGLDLHDVAVDAEQRHRVRACERHQNAAS